MLYVRQARGSFDDVAERIQSAAAIHHFGILAMHDLKDKLAAQGLALARECRIFEMCNAARTKKALESNPGVSTALPMRISVYEEGGAVKVAMLRPLSMLELVGDHDLIPLATEAEQVMMEIIEDACE
jgi:uncharacterized protein (DUF302 family)